MYSKAKNIQPPPPGYAGNRFRKEEPITEDVPEAIEVPVEKPHSHTEPLGFLRSMGKEELLLAGLIILLVGEKAESDTILMLILLLIC